MKKKIFPLTVVFLIIFAVLGVFWWLKNSDAVSSNSEPVRLVIPKGYGASQIGAKLFEQKLIKSPLAFKIYVQLTGVAGKIQAGEYDLVQNSSLPSLIKILLRGPTSIWITIPEGLRREEIALRFADGLSKTGNERDIFLDEFLENSKNKEGFLFPDTYLFPKDMTAGKIVNYQLATFDKKVSAFSGDVKKSGLSLNEIITLASLIEREAKIDDERPVIAGILLKRINAGWPLQVDASLQYAVASAKCKVQNLPGRVGAECDWWPGLSRDDLQINSPYNSYKFRDLPPAPIANPGLLSIKAAVFPQESPYWFYLHDSSGKIHYAETIEEHSQNISKYLGK